MNIFRKVLIVILALSTPIITTAKLNPTFTFSECFLKYNTMNGETEIILYNLRFTDETRMSEDRFKDMFDLTEFEIKDLAYDSLEAPTAIRVLAQTKNFMRNTPVQQLFSNLLNTEAEVDLGSGGPMEMKMNVLIAMQKDMYVADNNALQVLHNEKDNKILLEFDLSDFPSKPLEVVIGWKEKETLAEKMDKDYQHDADIFRLRHLKYYGELIEEYHKKTGKYPLQGDSEAQHYVLLAAPHQKKYTQGTPEQFKVTDVENFRAVLKEGLDRDIEFKFDPQKVPVGAPNFYIYMIEEESFFFAVHLYNGRSFTNPLDKHYNKLEITNEEPNRRGLWKLDALLNDKDFQAAVNEKPLKEEFFLDLEEQYK
ncbi:hypothetical protein P4C99_14395 [Pontiellaceae bacterium B1224]|nr:hypothetical protein [Pontiellaceae bacterium B1224]